MAGSTNPLFDVGRFSRSTFLPMDDSRPIWIVNMFGLSFHVFQFIDGRLRHSSFCRWTIPPFHFFNDGRFAQDDFFCFRLMMADRILKIVNAWMDVDGLIDSVESGYPSTEPICVDCFLYHLACFHCQYCTQMIPTIKVCIRFPIVAVLIDWKQTEEGGRMPVHLNGSMSRVQPIAGCVPIAHPFVNSRVRGRQMSHNGLPLIIRNLKSK